MLLVAHPRDRPWDGTGIEVGLGQADRPGHQVLAPQSGQHPLTLQATEQMLDMLALLLLGQTCGHQHDHRVALDAHGWPRLVEGDGRTFLTVSDETGPSAGGTVLWREHWWPWSERHAVHFSVGEDLPPVGQEEAEDPVRIWGPAGVVTLVAVPAGT